jgi:hypothetical protein
MFLGTGLATRILLAWRKVRNRKRVTQERKAIYFAALEFVRNPEALRVLADDFEKEGLTVEAAVMRKRADLRAMSKEKWEFFRTLCEIAIQKKDSNPQALDEMAAAFEAMTAAGPAAKLRRRAEERRMEILVESAMVQEIKS